MKFGKTEFKTAQTEFTVNPSTAPSAVFRTWNARQGTNYIAPQTPSFFISPSCDADYTYTWYADYQITQNNTGYPCMQNLAAITSTKELGLKVKDNNTGCIGEFNVNPPPPNRPRRLWPINSIPVITVSNNNICKGDSVKLIPKLNGNNIQDSNYLYLWSTDTAVLKIVGGSSSSSITITPDTTATYYLTIIDSNGLHLTTSGFQVAVNTQPRINIYSAEICVGSQLTLKSSLGSSYQWYANGGLLQGQISPSITINPDTTTSYTVVVGGCNNTPSPPTTVKVINPRITPSSATICLGNQVTLTSSLSPNYQWYDNSGFLKGITSQSITVSPISTNTYYVRSEMCNSQLVTITVIPQPSITPGGTISACNPIILTSSPGPSYQWYCNGTKMQGRTDQTFYTFNGSNSYYVVVGGCNNNTSPTVTVMVDKSSISPSSATICAGDEVTLTSSYGSSYQWNTGAKTQSITVSPNTTTSYNVIVGGCSPSPNITVTVNPKPDNTKIRMGGTVTIPYLIADVTPNFILYPDCNSNYEYTWLKDGFVDPKNTIYDCTHYIDGAIGRVLFRWGLKLTDKRTGCSATNFGDNRQIKYSDNINKMINAENTLTDKVIAENTLTDKVIAESSSPSISIFPNPTHDKITMQLAKGMEEAKVEIVSTLGISIAKDNKGGLQRTVNLGNNAKGLYTVKIIEKDGKVTIKKLVLE